MKKFSSVLEDFISKYPAVWEAHEKTGSVLHEAGPLDKKTTHLVQMAVAAALKLHGSFCSHLAQASEAGATPDEIMHTTLLLSNTAGFPTMIIAYQWAEEMLDKLK